MKITIDRNYITQLIQNILDKKMDKSEAVKLVDDILFIDDNDNYKIDETEHQLIIEVLHLIDCTEDTSWMHVSDKDLKNVLLILERTKAKDTLESILKIRK